MCHVLLACRTTSQAFESFVTAEYQHVSHLHAISNEIVHRDMCAVVWAARIVPDLLV